MNALEIDPCATRLGILPRSMLDMVLRSVNNLLFVYADRTVAIHAPYGFGGGTDRF